MIRNHNWFVFLVLIDFSMSYLFVYHILFIYFIYMLYEWDDKEFAFYSLTYYHTIIYGHTVLYTIF